MKFEEAKAPLSRWSKWTVYDGDLQRFAKSDAKFWNVVLEDEDSEKARSGLRSRIKALGLDGKVRLSSQKQSDGSWKLQLQKK